MKGFVALSLTIAVAILTSCSQEDADLVGPDIISNTYFPLSEGSSWTYAIAQLGSEMTFTGVVDGDTIIDSKKYIVMRASTPGSSSFTRIDAGGNVYTIDPRTGAELHVLKQNLKLGDSWSFDQNSGNGTPNHYTMTVATIDTVYTVRGRQYSNVAIITVVDEANVFGTVYTISGTHLYAKGVGLIRATFPDLAFTQDLVAYTIK